MSNNTCDHLNHNDMNEFAGQTGQNKDGVYKMYFVCAKCKTHFMTLNHIEDGLISITDLKEKDENMPLLFDEWYAENEDEINITLAETGADRELDFNPEKEFEDRYLKYLDSFKHNIH